MLGVEGIGIYRASIRLKNAVIEISSAGTGESPSMLWDDLINVIADASRLWGNVIAQEKRPFVRLELEPDDVADFHCTDMHDGDVSTLRKKPPSVTFEAAFIQIKSRYALSCKTKVFDLLS